MSSYAHHSMPRERDDIPLPAIEAPQPPAVDRRHGLALETVAIDEQLAKMRALLDQAEQAKAELDSALADRRWGIVASAATRLHALTGHLLKATERRPAAAAPKAA